MNALKSMHEKPNDELRDLASQYAEDGWTTQGKAPYEALLASGCTVSRSEVAAFREVTGALAMSIVPISPPEQLRARLLGTVASMSQAPSGQPPGVMYDKDGV